MPQDLDIHRQQPERMLANPDLFSGQYWRTKGDIPAFIEEYERDSYSIRGSSGREMAKRHARRSLPAGMVLLVKSLKIVDGELHTVELAAHPSDIEQADLRFLAEEFFANFEFADDAEQVRQRELLALNAEIAAVQSKIIAGPPDLPALPSAVSSPDLTSLVRLADRSDELQEQAAGHLVVAQQRAKWIERHTGEIQRSIEVMARFHKERAVAALASVEGTIRHVEKIQKGLRSLKLFTGDGVEIETIAEGKDAPSDEPLTIYQRRLFLDEELAVMLGKGGIDFDSLNDLPIFVQRNPAFIERVAPSPRSVVLLNVRRQAYLPEPAKSMAQALEQMTKERLDTASFLLIRNGENIHLVWSDLLWSFEGKRDDFDAMGLNRLFPSQLDLDKPFRGVDGREITAASLDYTDARSHFDDRSLTYKRLLILLWGLNDRLGLFGSFYDPAEFDGWASADFQFKHFRFIADDGLGLPENRANLFDWVQGKNSMLRHGSRVMCKWKGLDGPSSAPGCHRWSNRYSRYTQHARPAERWGLDLVVAKDGDLTVQMPVRYDASSHKKGLVTVNLLAETERGGINFLCLDDVALDELDRYIESRRDREHYLEYLAFFFEVRKQLVADRDAQSGVRQELIEAVVGASLADADAASSAVDRAMRLWRAANKAAIVQPRANAPKAFGAILSVIFILLGKDIDPGLLATKTAAALGRRPLRVSVSGAGKIVLYSEPNDSEHRPQLGTKYWVHRAVIERNKPFPGVLSESFEPIVRRADEVVLADFDGVKDWSNGTPPALLTYDEMGAILAEINQGAERARIFLDGVGDDRAFFECAKKRTHDASKRYVERVDYRVPVGLVLHGDVPEIVYLEEDPLFIYARGGEGQQAEVSRMLSNLYKNSESHIAQAVKIAKATGATLVRSDINGWKKTTRRDPHFYGTLQRTRYFQSAGTWRAALDQMQPTRLGTGPDGKPGYIRPLPDTYMLYFPAAAVEVLDALDAFTPDA